MNLLFEIISILALAAVVVFICQKIKVPSIVGFLLTGILTGPSGVGIVTNAEEVEVLSEIGIVLLLFTIGMEFSLKQLFKIKKAVFLGGTLQVLFTTGLFYGLALAMGLKFNTSLFIGMTVAISSTAIILKLLQEKAEIDTPYGQTALGILIFQDILIVPLMLLVPILAGVGTGSDDPWYMFAGKIILAIGSVVVLARWGVPAILYQITRTRNRELFMLSILVIGFAIAWLSHSIGLSLALGAFLAGLIISESEYSHQALGSIIPFRDIFLSIFFISIGMMVDLSFLGSNVVSIVLITVVVLVLKTIVASLATLSLGVSIRMSLLAGFSLSQIGEFSFLLSKAGLNHGLLSKHNYQLFLAVTVLTMGASPLMMLLAKKAANYISNRMPFSAESDLNEHSEDEVDNHLLIIGFGITGRNLSMAANKVNIPYSVLEMNPETVKEEKKNGIPIHYGDATNVEVLLHSGGAKARVAVVAINDPSATRRVVELLRRLNKKLSIIVRTRFVSEVQPLYKLGATDVIPEEFETAIEIFTRVMKKYLLTSAEINQFTSEIRSQAYEMLRAPSSQKNTLEAMQPLFREVEVGVFHINQQSDISGKTLKEIDFRNKYNITVLSIQRENQLLSNPAGDNYLKVNDRILAIGKPVDLACFGDVLEGKAVCES